MKMFSLKVAAAGDLLESARVTWLVITGSFLTGYAHTVIHWLQH
jgi:hypothetical protein